MEGLSLCSYFSNLVEMYVGGKIAGLEKKGPTLTYLIVEYSLIRSDRSIYLIREYSTIR